jgi:hypothetical protein
MVRYSMVSPFALHLVTSCKNTFKTWLSSHSKNSYYFHNSMSDLYDQCRILYHLYFLSLTGVKSGFLLMVRDKELKYLHKAGTLIPALNRLKMTGYDPGLIAQVLCSYAILHAYGDYGYSRLNSKYSLTPW